MQHALRDELVRAKDKFKADAAAGVVLDVRTGEIVSLVSVPDFDPTKPREALEPVRINRLTTGVYEMGSTFKALTIAMALDSGKVTLNSSFDARASLHYGSFFISDYHAQGRVLTVPEIFTYSSNIGAAKIALSAKASRPTRRFCVRSASSTGCAPNCPKAPSRSCRSTGANSTP